ncbi:6734_t:CDS:10 [Diversispora eburnea]|uniref:5'-deoxynucleotidase n=1 Tax=Diversispora eburnea TaxID=1213867 RepID=A0A9N8VI75_9GLOM|nr:6734_t:CDS:10 [Diversispora eburnea]
MDNTTTNTTSNILEFLHICEKLKKTKRTGWICHDIKNPESISDHMHRMSILSLLVKDSSLDRNKCVKMAVVHDLAEALVVYITPFEGISKEEKNPMRQMCINLLENSPQSQEIFALWQEYEDNSTNEAKFVKDIDKFEMIIQAYEYELSENKDLEQFFEITKGKFNHPEVKCWVEELYSKPSVFTPAEIESLKNSGNSKAKQIWLAKYKQSDFPEPDADDIDAIRSFMRVKYIQKRWLDESLLQIQPWKNPNNENLTNKGTFLINLNHRSSNFSDNSSNSSSLSRHSSLADVRSTTTSERRQSSISDISSDYSINISPLKSAPENNSNNFSNDSNILALPKPNVNPFNINLSNQIPSNTNSDISSTQTLQPTRPHVPTTFTHNAHNKPNQALPPQFNPLTSKPQQYQNPTQIQQFSTSINSPPQFGQQGQPITYSNQSQQPQQFQNARKPDLFTDIFENGQFTSKNLLNVMPTTHTNLNTNFNTNLNTNPNNNMNNTQRTVNASKPLNPFDHVHQGSLNSISNISSTKMAPQPPKQVSSPDPYEVFRTLNLNDSDMSLTSSRPSTTSSPAYSLSPSYHSSPVSQVSQAKHSASNINDIFGDLTPSTITSTEKFHNLSSQNLNNDIFSDFQSAPNATVNQQKSLSQPDFFTSQFSHFSSNDDFNDFSKFVQKPSRSEKFNNSSSGIFSTNISSPNLTSPQKDLNNMLHSMDPFNLNSFSHVPTTSSQSAKGLGHEKKISFDSAFNDLDPLKW